MKNLKLHSSGFWKGSFNRLYGSFGQKVVIKVQNLNELGTTIGISPVGRILSKQGQEIILAPKHLPGDEYLFEFSMFGEVPMTWEFDITSNSDVMVVGYEIYSDWIPEETLKEETNPCEK
ncbi:MAG: hypothetical protein PVH88_22935 [Ignavibacteria bacterium]|jgi:hypothetical protein